MSATASRETLGSVEVAFTKQYRAERVSPNVLASALRYARARAADGRTYVIEVGRSWIQISADGEPLIAVDAAGGGVYAPSHARHPSAEKIRHGSIGEHAREAEAKARRGAAA